MLYIHIGLHKTGSTSIQDSLYQSRNALRARSILYPYLRTNHSHCVYSAFSEEPGEYHVNLLKAIHGAELQSFNEISKLLLAAGIGSREYSKVIVSGEEISKLSTVELKRLRDFVAARGAGQPRIIAYFRDPEPWVSSFVQQSVRLGGVIPDAPADAPEPEYKSIILRFAEVFGRGNLDCRYFDPPSFGDGGLVADFLAATDSYDALDAVTAVHSNPPLTDPAIRILDRYNRMYPAFVGSTGARRLNPERPRPGRVNAWIRGIQGPRFQLASGFLQEVMQLYRDEIEWTQAETGIRFKNETYAPTLGTDVSGEQYQRIAELLHEIIQHQDRRDRPAVRQTARKLLGLQGPDWVFGKALTCCANH